MDHAFFIDLPHLVAVRKLLLLIILMKTATRDKTTSCVQVCGHLHESVIEHGVPLQAAVGSHSIKDKEE